MEYGICNLAIVPMRAEPNERSEMVSQILFGEAFEIIEWKDNWVQIITSFDNYTGWIGRLQFTMLGQQLFAQLKENPPRLTYHPITQAWKIADNSIVYLPIGASLSFLKGTTCNIGPERFEIIGQAGEYDEVDIIAKSFLNTPYLWGGRTHFGIDCSGFTQAVFRLCCSINLKRDASLQAEDGNIVNSLADIKLGDLAFFDNAEGKITHVGIMLNKMQIIHASGKVKIDLLENKGIYSEEQKRYTHKLKVIKRYL
jgi:gamma-D-glutamyl-L-lysine dipeptidyl-peptidase